MITQCNTLFYKIVINRQIFQQLLAYKKANRLP